MFPKYFQNIIIGVYVILFVENIFNVIMHDKNKKSDGFIHMVKCIDFFTG